MFTLRDIFIISGCEVFNISGQLKTVMANNAREACWQRIADAFFSLLSDALLIGKFTKKKKKIMTTLKGGKIFFFYIIVINSILSCINLTTQHKPVVGVYRTCIA